MRQLERRTRRVLEMVRELQKLQGLQGPQELQELQELHEPQKLRPEGITPADVAARSRAEGDPLAAWEVRAALSELERAGLVEIDPRDCSWCTSGVVPGTTDRAQV